MSLISDDPKYPRVTTLPLAWFLDRQVCADQLEVLRQEWGETIPLTRDSLLRAVELDLDLSWFAERYLSPPLWSEYWNQAVLLQAEFKRQVAPFRAEYQRQAARVLWALIQAAP